MNERNNIVEQREPGVEIRTGGKVRVSRWTTGAAALYMSAILALSACGGSGGGTPGSSAATGAPATNVPATNAPASNVPASNPPATNTPAPSVPVTNSPATNPPAGASSYAMAITVENGVDGERDVPQVSVQLCAPGTSICQTIDNILVDTGSTGVRLASAALDPRLLAALPQETVSSGTLNACGQFVDGYTWGTVRTADVTIGPKQARSLPVQIFGDPAAGSAPRACTDNGTLSAEDTPQAFGTNGVIGVAELLQDCGTTCTQLVVPGNYYTCSGSCQGVKVPLSLQVSNPVASFAQDNNGVVIDLPQIGVTGQVSAAGTLYFGVGTEPDNAMNGAVALQTDPDSLMNFVTYNAMSYPDSFIDSGSNFVYLSTASIPACPASSSVAGMYCPVSALNLSATFLTMSSSTISEAFAIGDALTILGDNPAFGAFNNVAASVSSMLTGNTIDFGIPFFFGKSIGLVNEGQSALGKNGPFVAVGPG